MLSHTLLFICFFFFILSCVLITHGTRCYYVMNRHLILKHENVSQVRQREEDSRCSKMMLKFREDKIQRMESLVGGLIPADAYLLDENTALSEEIQLLRAKVDRNPEVTRFALENIRLLEQLRRLLLLHKNYLAKFWLPCLLTILKFASIDFKISTKKGRGKCC